MNRGDMLRRIKAREIESRKRASRLQDWLGWTVCRDAVGQAYTTALHSANAWRALRGTLVQTYRLFQDHRRRK